MNKNVKSYNIGLDIGTTSVGWAVIDDDNNIIKKGKHPLWGVRLFDEAQTAVDRRMKRSSRRRFDRRRWRIKLLQDEFREEINNPNFYTILKESFFCNDDKSIKLTDELKKKASKYLKEYPTIYHLRKKLIEDSSKMDIHLVYLAIHHIIKYRGNFLYEGNDFNIDSLDITSCLKKLSELLKEYKFICEDLDVKSIEDSLLLKSKNDKKKIVSDNLKKVSYETSFASELTKLLIGDTANLNKLFNIESDEDIKVSFKGSSFEDSEDKIVQVFEENIDIIYSCKELYNIVFIKSLFNSSDIKYLSQLMVANYLKHHDDKKELKEIFKGTPYLKEIFKDTKNKKCIYSLYINNDNLFKNSDDFYKKIKDFANKLTDESKKERFNKYVIPKMELNEFMPRITTTDNNKYPYQLNEVELIKIIENQGKYYPFLLEKVDGEYRIVKLLKFRIPYYVGPLNDYNNDNYWMCRKENMENIKITPYNFKNVVDIDLSAENFIKRMVSNCTYLLQEKAMPANSILYSKFKVLNELKQIRFNKLPLSQENQKYIYEELFLKYNCTITENIFKNFILENRNTFGMFDDFEITGYSDNKKFANSMKSYHDFLGLDGVFANTSYDEDDAEEIIEWITIFEDKNILKRKINQKYQELSSDAVNKILKFKYKGWSRLSKKLLTGLKSKTGETIIEIMEKEKYNFMYIINASEYGFANIISNENFGLIDKGMFKYESVDKLVTSPQNKRGIWQALKVVQAIYEKMDKVEPKYISIEMARSSGEKKRTEDKKSKLQNIYKTFVKDEHTKKILEELNTIDNKELAKKKIYLYFLQNGLSLYSMKPLSLEDLDSTTDIDHIIPQSIYKDDSLDNCALVLKTENAIKADSRVLPYNYRNKENEEWWSILTDRGMMTKKKFERLKRSYYSDKDIEGFINRQLVETRQITKNVAEILENTFNDSKVIYLHANLSSEYRNKFELYKYRGLNDLHHAHDAYLAIVLGMYTKKYFGKKIDDDKLKILSEFMKENKEARSVLNKGYTINSLDNTYGSLFSDATLEEINKINSTVDKNLYRNDITVSYKTFESDGKLFKETIHNKNESSNNKISLKNNLDVNKYGFYSDNVNRYFSLVKIKGVNRLVIIPSHKINDIKGYISSLANTNDVEVIKDKILKGTLLSMNFDGEYQDVIVSGGGKMLCEIKNAKQFKLSREMQEKYKYILNYIFNNKEFEINDITLNNQLDDLVNDIHLISKQFPLLAPKIQKYFNLYKIDFSVEKKLVFIKDYISLFKANKSLQPTTIEKIKLRFNGVSITKGKIINKNILGMKEKIYEF